MKARPIEQVLEPVAELLAPLAAASLGLPSRVGTEGAVPARLGRERLLEVMQNYATYYASGEGHTARAKRYDLQHFIEFLAGSPAQVQDVLVDDWTLQKTKDFVDSRLAQGEAPATVSRRLATIKHLGRTLAERVPGYINPAREAKSPVIPQTRPHGLDPDEVLLLRQAADSEVQQSKHGFLAVRNRSLLELLLATGLRADEVRLLVFGQLSDDSNWLKNVKTKGRKFRNVYLDSEVRTILAEYLQCREQELCTKFPSYTQLNAAERGRFPVFISTYSAQLGSPLTFGMSPKSIWRVISGLGKQALLLASVNQRSVGKLHPHKLRHTFAHGLLDSSKDVRLVAQALGHSDVRITMRYTERSAEQVAAAIEAKVKAQSTPPSPKAVVRPQR